MKLNALLVPLGVMFACPVMAGQWVGSAALNSADTTTQVYSTGSVGSVVATNNSSTLLQITLTLSALSSSQIAMGSTQTTTGGDSRIQRQVTACLYWKEDFVGEGFPTTTINVRRRRSFSLSSLYSGPAQYISGSSSYISGDTGTVQAVATSPGGTGSPISSAGSTDVYGSASLTWYVDSVDANGLVTWRGETTLVSGTVKALTGIYANQFTRRSGASCGASAAATEIYDFFL